MHKFDYKGICKIHFQKFASFIISEVGKYYVDNPCQSEQEYDQNSLAGTFQPESLKARVSCCGMNGATCVTKGNATDNCFHTATYDEAVSQCTAMNMRLCSRQELLSNICCESGAMKWPGYDFAWTSTKEPGAS